MSDKKCTNISHSHFDFSATVQCYVVYDTVHHLKERKFVQLRCAVVRAMKSLFGDRTHPYLVRRYTNGHIQETNGLFTVPLLFKASRNLRRYSIYSQEQQRSIDLSSYVPVPSLLLDLCPLPDQWYLLFFFVSRQKGEEKKQVECTSIIGFKSGLGIAWDL